MTANTDNPDGVGKSRQRNDSRNDSHLPECDYEQTKDVCYCDMLRSCEQRVWDAAREAVVGQIAPRIRAAAQLWSCDPDDCPLCDCNLNDEGREHIRTIAAREERDAVAAIDALAVDR